MAREELHSGGSSSHHSCPQPLHPEPYTREELRTQGAAAVKEAEARRAEFDQHMGEGRANYVGLVPCTLSYIPVHAVVVFPLPPSCSFHPEARASFRPCSPKAPIAFRHTLSPPALLSPPLLPADASEAELHECQSRLSAGQEEAARLTSELQKLQYHTENYASVFAENDGLSHRLTLAEVCVCGRGGRTMEAGFPSISRWRF